MLLLIGVGAASLLVGKVLYDAVTEEEPAKPKKKPRRKSKLEKNMARLKRELRADDRRKVAILGQPGAGKSSLLKKMTGGKVVPLPEIGIQTDATNWHDDLGCSLLSRYENDVFVDVPGYDTPSHPTHVFLSLFPFKLFDVLVLVIHGKVHASDEKISRKIIRSGKQFFVVRSFSDNQEKGEHLSVEKDIRKKLGLNQSAPILFCSNRTGEGVEAVFTSISS